MMFLDEYSHFWWRLIDLTNQKKIPLSDFVYD